MPLLQNHIAVITGAGSGIGRAIANGYAREGARVVLLDRDEKAAAEAANPLVHDGEKLVPSVTRVFSKGRDLYIFAQAYQRAFTTTQPLVAFVSFYRGDVKAFETAPLEITEGLDAKTKALPVRFSVPLSKLLPGRYTCQVSVLDPQAQKFAFWRAPIVMVQ